MEIGSRSGPARSKRSAEALLCSTRRLAQAPQGRSLVADELFQSHPLAGVGRVSPPNIQRGNEIVHQVQQTQVTLIRQHHASRPAVSSEIDGVRGGALLDEAPIEARQALASLLHREDLGRDSGVRRPGSVLPYGSHLAQSGLDVGVQRQMGHARPSITMDLYVHEFETARRREQVSDRLTAALGGLVESDIF
jgi:hypothetical protein